MSLKDRLRRHPHLVVLLQIDDTPHSIALGTAVGIFIALTPTIGIQMYAALIVCLWLRCNRIWAVAMVWISNPLTMVPIYYGSYIFGCLLMGRPFTYRFAKFQEDLNAVFSQNGIVAILQEFWHRLVAMGLEVTIPMFLGGLVTGAVCSVPSYFIIYRIILKNRARKTAKEARELASEASEATEASATER